MKAFYLLFLFSIVSFGQHTDNDGYGKGAPERPQPMRIVFMEMVQLQRIFI